MPHADEAFPAGMTINPNHNAVWNDARDAFEETTNVGRELQIAGRRVDRDDRLPSPVRLAENPRDQIRLELNAGIEDVPDSRRALNIVDAGPEDDDSDAE